MLLLDQLHAVSLNPFNAKFYTLSSLAITGNAVDYLVRAAAIRRQLKYMDSPDYIPPATQSQIDNASADRPDDPRRSVKPSPLSERLDNIKRELRKQIWQGARGLLEGSIMVLGGWDRIWIYSERVTAGILVRTGLKRGYLITPMIAGGILTTIGLVTTSAVSGLFELYYSPDPIARAKTYLSSLLVDPRKPDLYNPSLWSPLFQAFLKFVVGLGIQAALLAGATEIYENRSRWLERTGWGLGFSLLAVMGGTLLMLDAVIFGFYLRSKYWERMKDFPGLTEEDEERVIPLSDWYLLDSVERGEKDASASYTEGDEKPSTSASFTLQESHLRQAVQEAARNTGFGGQFEIWVQRDISKRKIKEPATAIARDDIAIQQYLSPQVVKRKNGRFLVLQESQLLDLSLEENVALAAMALSPKCKPFSESHFVGMQLSLAITILGPAILHDYYVKHPELLASLFPTAIRHPTGHTAQSIPLLLSVAISSAVTQPWYAIQSRLMAAFERYTPLKGDKAIAEAGFARGLRSLYDKRRGAKAVLLAEERQVTDYGTLDSYFRSIVGYGAAWTERMRLLSRYT